MLADSEIASLMAAYIVSPVAQIAQTAFRRRLVEQWPIEEGARVLEIGCGQGDMTAVLADAVGESGKVLAVDLATPAYGAPVTIGDSARHLAQGPLGRRIEFRFLFDVLQESFPQDSFDVVVLAHCTWYFDSLDKLRDTLAHIRGWAPELCLSEWDLQPASLEQLAHLLAVLVQGQVEAFRSQSEANVRTPYSRETLRRLLDESGWRISSEALADASELDDAKWEVGDCLRRTSNDAASTEMPAKLRDLVEAQLDVLRRLPVGAPLPAYSVVAARS